MIVSPSKSPAYGKASEKFFDLVLIEQEKLQRGVNIKLKITIDDGQPPIVIEL